MSNLNQIRTEIAQTRTAISQVGNQPLNEKDTLAQVDDLIRRCRMNFDVDHLGINLAHPGQLQPSDIVSAAFGMSDGDKLLAILATFAEDRMRELLTASAMKFCDKKSTPQSKRGDQIMALQQRLLELEREEEAEFMGLEASGVTGISRRPDADMAAILLMDD